MVFWMAVTFGVGMALIAMDYVMSSKKKGGFNNTDRQRLIGIFWLVVMLTALVGSLIWVSSKVD